MTPQRAAEIQVVLEGVPLPARKRELVAYARTEDDRAARELEAIEDREYATLDEVGEELLQVQPPAGSRAEPLPAAESGSPPGGRDYTEPHPDPGAVRADAPPGNPPQKTLEKQTTVQAEQKARQDAGR